jgi:hypothetical protein
MTILTVRTSLQERHPQCWPLRSPVQLICMIVLAAMLLGWATAGSAQQIPPLVALSATAAASNPVLVDRRAELLRDREALHGKIDSLNAQCGAVAEGSAAEATCKREQAALLGALNDHIQQSKEFNDAAQAAIVSASQTAPAPFFGGKGAHVINGINALAKQLGWSAYKRARLDASLHRLGFDGDSGSTRNQIRETWQNIFARSQDAELLREASQGGGLGFPGAGKQRPGQTDCAIFALANATGLPYGVVAARATELIRQAEWRDADERANPQAIVEKQGLNGGEVIMLTEIFGQSAVAPSADFAKTLNAGRPIMVNVVPSNGDVRSGHEVVLTKTFQHDGETWFVMRNSMQGPQEHLFLSAKELSTVIQENGVVYLPEPGTTPVLLGNNGASL